MSSTPTAERLRAAGCDTGSNVTRSLLGYGVLAGPFYVVASLIEATTRSGFDLTRHSWSLLENGSLGWIHRLVLGLAGLMVLAAAVGLWRVLRGGVGARAVPILVGGYGAGMVAAGIFTADPTDGFPPGTPAGQGTVSWHGLLHLASGGVGFLCLVAACMVLARRFAKAGEGRWSAVTAVVGVVFLAAFVGIASGGASRALVIAFTVAILITWTWFSTLHVRLYRDTRR